MKKKNILFNLLDRMSVRFLAITTVSVICILAVVGLTIWLAKSNNISIGNKERLVITQAQIDAVEEISQWEFLTVTDEELVDTTRHGFFGDDHLVRIYYGTLRLGINLNDAPEEWLSAQADTVVAILPPVTLLDDDFIDEARTRTFYEEGTWSQADRERLYHKAQRQMRLRCLTPSNISSAEKQASRQFDNLLHSMGFKHVRVRFKDTSS